MSWPNSHKTGISSHENNCQYYIVLHCFKIVSLRLC